MHLTPGSLMNRRILSATSRCALVGLCAAFVSWSAPARAGDVHDLQRGLPLEVEDTQTGKHREMQFQTSARYELDDDGGDLLIVEPELQYSFTDNFQVEVSYPIRAGSGDRTGAGDVVVAGLYRFLEEKSPGFDNDPWPSLAVKGEFRLPTGVNSDGLDTTVRFIATKTLTESEPQDRLHFNLAWEHNMAAESGERANRFGVILGYSRKLDDQTVVLADVVREQELEEGEDSTVLEAGVMRQLSEELTISAGLGFGLGEDSPDLRATVGFQYTF